MKIKLLIMAIATAGMVLSLSACDPTQPITTPTVPVTPTVAPTVAPTVPPTVAPTVPPTTPPSIDASYEKVTCGPLKPTETGDPFSTHYLSITRLEDRVDVKFSRVPTKIEFTDPAYTTLFGDQITKLTKAGSSQGTAELTFAEATRQMNIEFNGGTSSAVVLTLRSWDQFGAYARGTSVEFGSNVVAAYSSNVQNPDFNTANVGTVSSSRSIYTSTTWDTIALYGADSVGESLVRLNQGAYNATNSFVDIGQGMGIRGSSIEGSATGIGQYRALAQFEQQGFGFGCEAESFIGSQITTTRHLNIKKAGLLTRFFNSYFKDFVVLTGI